MGRSRADEILREWSVVSNTAQRPIAAPRLNVHRSAPLGLAAAGVVAILVIALVLPQFIDHTAPIIGTSPSATARSTATQVTASPSPAESSAPTPGPSEPEATPTAVPSAPAAPAVRIVADVPGCTYHMTPYAFADGRWYVSCPSGDPSKAGTTAAIDVATGKVVARYDLPFGRIAVAAGALFVSDPMPSVCPDPCEISPTVKRVDLQTGRVTTQIADRFVLGGAGQYVLIAHQSANGGPGTVDPAIGLEKVDPATGRVVGKIDVGSDWVIASAGELWSYVGCSASGNPPCALRHLSADDGHEIASYSLPVGVPDPGWPQRIGDTFWVVLGSAQSEYIVKLDDQRSPTTSPNLLTIPFVMGDKVYTFTYGNQIQLLDQKTWQPVKSWTLTEGMMQPVVVGDTIWIDAGVPSGLEKLELP